MPFQKVQSEKLSISVLQQIELLILRGILRPGERLPAERDLAERFGVSRPSLREAISELEGRNLLLTRPGSGVFVAEVLGSAFSEPLIALFSSHDEALIDYLSFRRDLEGMAAERAARTASETDLELINLVFQKMVTANKNRDSKAEAALDAEFHMTIIEASHNVIMLHMMRSMFEMLRMGVFYNRQIMFQQQTTRATLLEQHSAINDALQARDHKAARGAVETHLDFIDSAMRNQRIIEHNEMVAQLKIDHLKGQS
ncbi:MAG: FCD domain-containing protein [Alphaproteobacteria bacterium]|nr:FCD domain-containing protein [Alphaproteobacteria bacterium]